MTRFNAISYLFDGAGQPKKKVGSLADTMREVEAAMLPSLQTRRLGVTADEPAERVFIGNKASSVVEASHRDFLDHASVHVPGVTASGMAIVTAECQFGKRQLCAFTDDVGESLMVRIGNRVLAVYRLATNQLLLAKGEENAAAASAWMVSALAQIRTLPIGWAHLFGPPLASDQRVLLVGDERPTHFLRQTMGFLELESERIRRFIERGGQVRLLPRMCFVDPLAVFPELRGGVRLTTHGTLDGLQGIANGMRIMHRAFRGEQQSVEWARRWVAGFNQPDRNAPQAFRVLVSLDVEKDRFVNQREALRWAIRFLDRLARRAGKPLEIMWDGWTIGPDAPLPRDLDIMDDIDALAADLVEGMALSTISGYRMTIPEKLVEMRHCTLALSPQGTAALLPCRILRLPTVTYHAPETVRTVREEIDERAFFPVSDVFLQETPESVHAVRHLKKFFVEPRGIIMKIKSILRGQPAPGAAN
jgi:hypothetical protein